MDIKRIQEDTDHFISQLWGTCISILKILVRSKYNIQLPLAESKSCIILGNGPSLNESLKSDIELLKKSTLFCVNNFATTPEFFILKPTNYALLDPGFFMDKTREDVVATLTTLKNNVDWELNFYIPYMYRNDVDIQFLIKQNSFVKVRFYNYVVFKGFKRFGFYVFKKNLAMPQLYNILGACIFIAINRGYKEINITGADHSWFNDIEINEANELCRKDKHFYDTNIPIPLTPIIDPVSMKHQTVGDFFKALCSVFNTYYILDEYAKAMGSSVYNISKFSYIDAFSRKKNL